MGIMDVGPVELLTLILTLGLVFQWFRHRQLHGRLEQLSASNEERTIAKTTSSAAAIVTIAGEESPAAGAARLPNTPSWQQSSGAAVGQPRPRPGPGVGRPGPLDQQSGPVPAQRRQRPAVDDTRRWSCLGEATEVPPNQASRTREGSRGWYVEGEQGLSVGRERAD